MCPEQQSKGVCKLTRCPYPHQTRTIKIEQSHIEKPDCVRIKRRKQTSKCSTKDYFIQTAVKTNAEACNAIDSNEQDAKLNVKRYFDEDRNDVVAASAADKTELNSKMTCDQSNSNNSTSESSNTSTAATPSKRNAETNEGNVEKIIVKRKPIVGSLPSFIPIG